MKTTILQLSTGATGILSSSVADSLTHAAQNVPVIQNAVIPVDHTALFAQMFIAACTLIGLFLNHRRGVNQIN